MQNSRGWLISASASESRCLALTCAGTGGAAGTSACRFLRSFQYHQAKAARANAAKAHITHAHGLGISTGGLISRNPPPATDAFKFVAAIKLWTPGLWTYPCNRRFSLVSKNLANSIP